MVIYLLRLSTSHLLRAIEGLPAANRRALAASLTELAAAMHGDRRPAVMFFEESGKGGNE